VEDKTRVDSAEAKRASALVPLTAQRDQASARIEYSTQALAMLEPVLNLLKDRVDKLQKHIEESLTPECKEAAKVSDALNAVRELIISLDRCPGRNDFQLKIPGEDTTTAALSTTGAASKLQKVSTKSNAKAKAPKSTPTAPQTVTVKSDATPAIPSLLTTKHHPHSVWPLRMVHFVDKKTVNSEVHSELQEHGEVHQIDDDDNSKEKNHPTEEDENVSSTDTANTTDKKRKDKDRKGGTISITVESTSTLQE